MNTHHGERGMMIAVETAIILPVLLLLVGLLIVLARGQLAQMTVESAAAQAARAASIERNTTAAVEAARSVAASSLSDSGVECRSQDITVDARGLLAPIGTSAAVSVTVTCVADMGVGLPGFPETYALTATRTSPVDTFRTR